MRHARRPETAGEERTTDATPPSSLGAGRYELHRALGATRSPDVVYLARDRRRDRDVAVALLRTVGLSEGERLRLRREAEAIRRLGPHPNFVPVHDVLEEAGWLSIVYAHMVEPDLSVSIREAPQGRLPVDEAIGVALQVCRALDHAHARGVVHRAVAPQRIWLTSHYGARLGGFRLDLGVGAASGGTDCAYVAPEQVLGAHVDARSDLYALGATIYHMTTGRPPFLGDSVAVISQHLRAEPVAPSWRAAEVPRALEELVLELLDKEPGRRPQTASVVRGRLQSLTAPRVEPVRHDARSNPLDGLAAGIYVGREAEMERLHRALDGACAGRFGLALLTGDAGMGKTAAGEELEAYARIRGADVLWGRCPEGPGASPWRHWIELITRWLRTREPREILADLGGGAAELAALVPEIREMLPGMPPPSPDAEKARHRLFEDVASLLRSASRRRPLLLVLDDLEWADEASLLLLRFLARELRSAAILVLAMHGDLTRGHRPSVTVLLQALGKLEGVEQIRLRGLDAAAVGRLIRRVAGVDCAPATVEEVTRLAGGCPFLVHEVLRVWALEHGLEETLVSVSEAELPATAGDLVRRRLDHLAPASRQALRVASVFGMEVSRELLGRLSGATCETATRHLERAAAGRIVARATESGRYRFAHTLVRAALYEELPVALRERLHGVAAQALLDDVTGPDDTRHAEVAHHLSNAGAERDAGKLVDACEAAAAWARSQRAWEEAAAQLEGAVSVLENGELEDEARRCRLIVSLAETRALAGDARAAREAAQRGVETSRSIGCGTLLARAALAYASSGAVSSGSDRRTTELLDEALKALDEDETCLRARLLGLLAGELSGDVERMEEVLVEATKLAEQSRDPGVRARVRHLWLRSLPGGQPDGSLSEARRAVALARRADEPTSELRAWQEVLALALWRGELAEARKAVMAERLLAERIGNPSVRSVAALHQAALAALEGRFGEASDLVRRVEEAAPGSSGIALSYFCETLRFVLAWQQGLAMSPGPGRKSAAPYPDLPLERAFLCAGYASSGDRNEARRELAVLARHDFGRSGRDPGLLAAVVLAADASGRLEATGHSAVLYRWLRPFSGRVSFVPGVIACLGPIDLVLGRLAARIGRRERAVAHLAAALDLCRRMQARPFLAESRYALGSVIGRGDGPEARQRALLELERAAVTADGLGMERLAGQARRLSSELEGTIEEGSPGVDRRPPSSP